MDLCHRLDAGASVGQCALHVLILGAAGLEREQSGHHGEAVLHPMAHLAAQEVLPFERDLELGLRALALDGAAEQVGEALHEGDVGGAEHALAGVVHLQHAVMALSVGDEHVHGPTDAVARHQLRRAKAGFVLQMVGDDGPAGLQGVARGRGEIGTDHRPADAVRLPADTGADEEHVLRRLIFERLAELRLHALGAEFGRPLQQRHEFGGAQRLDAEIGQDRLLAQPEVERLRRDLGHRVVSEFPECGAARERCTVAGDGVGNMGRLGAP